ncbi:hypothetical protein CBR_g31674 [Chara braunii]|uniref:Uncharacterized protein n=1 Tax=Chara braunii TaxID=69332 RepID=A0A388JY00_CHABU|nr:hypothetical protein CBR_g31674 [Chara braunii]|eukprot:GBG62655.1 hypothetical protein CBR_g31674 [Chara braunii]
MSTSITRVAGTMLAACGSGIRCSSGRLRHSAARSSSSDVAVVPAAGSSWLPRGNLLGVWAWKLRLRPLRSVTCYYYFLEGNAEGGSFRNGAGGSRTGAMAAMSVSARSFARPPLRPLPLPLPAPRATGPTLSMTGTQPLGDLLVASENSPPSPCARSMMGKLGEEGGGYGGSSRKMKDGFGDSRRKVTVARSADSKGEIRTESGGGVGGEGGGVGGGGGGGGGGGRKGGGGGGGGHGGSRDDAQDGFSEGKTRGGISGLWQSYLALIDKYPVMTKAVTSMLLNVVADIICQVVIEGAQKLDVHRVTVNATIGLCLVGPALHYWYLALSRFVTIKGTPGVLTCLALDQLFFAPIFITSFFTSLLTLEGRADDIIPKLKQDFVNTLIANWKLWVPFQFINFAFIPQPLQVGSERAQQPFLIMYLCFEV